MDIRIGFRALACAAVTAIAAPAASWQEPAGPGAPVWQASPPPTADRQDPADSLYHAAREALNRNEYEESARLFRALRERFPRSAYVPDSYYWEAFSLFRAGDVEDLEAARDALDEQARRHPAAATRADGSAAQLALRIAGTLAQRGNARAAEDVARAAEDASRGTQRVAASCRSDDDGVRTAALNALLHMDGERAIPILRRVLEDHDACNDALRRRAVFLVSQKPTPETVDLLVSALRHDPSAAVRRDAVFWLSQVGDERAVHALEEAVRSSDDRAVRKNALFALSQHRSPRASELLRAIARGQDAPEDLRENAVFFLSQRGSEEDARFLRELYGSASGDKLRKKIIFAVSQMNRAENGKWLLGIAADPNEPVSLRKDALFWAGQGGGVSFADLVALYDRMPDRELREQLIFVYAQRREDEAIEQLIRIARADPDTQLRKRAIFWLGQSRDPRAAEALLELIRND